MLTRAHSLDFKVLSSHLYMGKLANPHTKGMMEISSQKTEKTDSINPHGEQADAYIGPMSVMAWMYIMYEDKFVDEAPIIFNVKQDVSLKQAYRVFIEDFTNIFLLASKVVNPESKKFGFSDIKIHDPGEEFYQFVSLAAALDFFKMCNLEVPEWLEDFYTVIEQIQIQKTSPIPPIAEYLLSLSFIQLIYENLNQHHDHLDLELVEDKHNQLANRKGTAQLNIQNPPNSKTINPMGKHADVYIGNGIIGVELEIIYEQKLIEKIPGVFQTKEAVSLKDGFLPFITDFAQIYQCVCKELNPEGKKLVFSRFQISKISDKFYNWLPIDYMEDAYKGRELKKPEWLENFYLKAKEIQQIPESKEDKKSE